MLCDYCQQEMEDTAALAVLYRLMGRDDGPKVDPVEFPWSCRGCKTSRSIPTVYPRQEGTH